MKLTSAALALLAPVSSAAPPFVAEWHVNASASCAAGTGSAATPFCTIGEAVLAASDGDTIRIAPGTYTETLLLAKDLTLVGTDGEAVTILDAQSLGGSAVAVEGASQVAIRGLTIRNAGRNGVEIRSSEPPAAVTIANATISGHAQGGISNANGTLTLNTSTVSGNLGYRGGGIYNAADGTVTVQGCLVTGNEVLGVLYPSGGGIFSRGSLTVLDSQVVGNEAESIGRTFDHAYGGGIYNDVDGVAVIRNSSVSGNRAWVPNNYIGCSTGGGGIDNRGTMTVEGCLVADNSILPSYYDEGRGIDSRSGKLTLRSTTVADTYGGFFLGRVALRATSDSRIADSIVWSRNAPANVQPQITGSSGLPFVHHSDVQGGWSGPGGFNANEDPLFVNPAAQDYRLSASSGLVDRGDPDSGLLGTDLAGGSRLNDGDLDRALVIDMGAYELSHVALSVSGDATPGGELTLTVTGRAGMDLLLAIGTPAAQGLRRDPFGILFFDLGAPVKVVSFGTIPSATAITIPPTVVGPVSVVMQLLALEPPGAGGKRAGNVSNPVALTVL